MEKYAIYGVGLLAVICYALLAPLIKQPGAVFSPYLIMLFNSAIIFFLALPFYLTQSEKVDWASVEPKIWWLILANGVINMIGFWLFMKAIGGMPIWHYKMIALTTPIFAGFAAYLLLKEEVSARLFIGLAIASVGIYVAVKPAWKKYLSLVAPAL